MAITKQEFMDGIKEMILDIDDPHGEFSVLAKEFADIESDIMEHDPVLASKFGNVVAAVQEMGRYVKSRAEN